MTMSNLQIDERGSVEMDTHIDGSKVNHITKTAKITGKVQTYFINKFLNKRKAE